MVAVVVLVPVVAKGDVEAPVVVVAKAVVVVAKTVAVVAKTVVVTPFVAVFV